MIVADANVLAYLYLPSEHSERAEALLEHDPQWAAPLLWRSEFRSVLGGYLRRKAMNLAEARALQAEAEAHMVGSEYDVDSGRVLELVRDSRCSAYDCEYVALAMQLGVRLVTMDRELLRSFPRQTVGLSTFGR